MVRKPARIASVFATVLLLGGPVIARAAEITLVWDASPDPTVTGYWVHMGSEAGVYTQRLDVGLTTSHTLTVPDNTRLHFAVQAYNAAGLGSELSNDARVLPFLPGYSWDRFGIPRLTLYWQHRLTSALATWTMDRWTMVEGNGVSPSRPSDPGWQLVATTDFDGDGGLDLMWRHNSTGRVAGWRMFAGVMVDGSMFSPDREPDLAWEVRSVHDLTGDGYADLIWQNRTTNALRIWAMVGGTRVATYTPRPAAVPSREWVVEGSGDFDQDFKPDLLVRNSRTGLVSIWLMDGLTRREIVDVATNSSTSWTVTGVVDIDGDTTQDILWQHPTDGTLAAWLMTGTVLRDGLLLSPSRVSDTNWRMVSAR